MKNNVATFIEKSRSLFHKSLINVEKQLYINTSYECNRVSRPLNCTTTVTINMRKRKLLRRIMLSLVKQFATQQQNANKKPKVRTDCYTPQSSCRGHAIKRIKYNEILDTHQPKSTANQRWKTR